MKIEIMAKSKSGRVTYKVEFSQNEGKFAVFCNCMAGVAQTKLPSQNLLTRR